MTLNVDWVGIIFALLLGYIDDFFGPQLYHYEDEIVNAVTLTNEGKLRLEQFN